MKKVKIFNSIKEFEDFVNREDIEIIQIDAKACEQSYSYQEGFIGMIFYKELK